jgi:hypothetical protein
MSERAGVFDGLDLSGFTPQPKQEKATAEKVRQVAEKAEFKSREPVQKKPRRPQRVYRTGRNAQFNVKADPAVVDEFYAIAESQGWVLGLALEKAVAALRREVGRAGGKQAQSSESNSA